MTFGYISGSPCLISALLLFTVRPQDVGYSYLCNG